MTHFLLVCLGGAIGTGARFGLYAMRLPVSATLVINALGSFILAFLVSRFSLSNDVRDFLVIGCLGGFTTYSAFNQETLHMLEQGAWSRAIGYAGLMVGLCLLCGFIGATLGRRL